MGASAHFESSNESEDEETKIDPDDIKKGAGGQWVDEDDEE